MISAGSQAFAAVVRRVGGPDVARRLGVTRGAVHHWSSARKKPTPAVRKAIAKHWGVEIALWDTAAVAEAPTAPELDKTSEKVTRSAETSTGSRKRDRKGSKAAHVDEGDPVAVCRDTIRRLRQELERLQGDKVATSKERTQISSALTQATRLLAKLTGSLEVSQSQILRSPHWRKLIETMVEAVRPFPGACAAVGEALRGLDG